MYAILPEEIKWVLQIMEKHHKEVYLVGGCVRDMLIGRSIHDYDIASSALPQETIDIFVQEGSHVIPTGLKHGTISVIVNDHTVEITTYRIEQEYSNHRAPDVVSFTRNLRDDLSRRDFTMNAIAYHPDKGFVDPFGGREDIQNRVIRCVGDANLRLQEDALRILRALRFHAVLGFHLEETSVRAIQHHASLLSYVSKERIQTEFNKILMADMPDTLAMLRRYQVLPYILPGYECIYDVEQHNPWHCYDLFTHTDKALNHTKGYPLSAKLAIVLHDIGKLDTVTFDEHGIAHYPMHAKVSAQKAVVFLKELKYSNALIEEVKTLILYHDYHVVDKRRVMRRFLAHLDNKEELAQRVFQVQLADDQAKNDEKAHESIDMLYRCMDLLKVMLEEEEMVSLKNLAVNGHDIMALGYRGVAVGQLLQDCLQHVIDCPQHNQKEYLVEWIKKKGDDFA